MSGITDKDIIHKELDLIQDVIKRMAANSFQVKTWTMGIVTAVLAFKNEEVFSAGKTPSHAGIAITLVLLLPILCFWILDGFFLKTEKIYRNLYQWVITNRELAKDHLYDLQTFQRKDYSVSLSQPPTVDLTASVGNTWKVMRTYTLKIFYVIPAAVVIALAIYNYLK